MSEQTVQLVMPRRVLWRLRTSYDSATADDYLRMKYCSAKRFALAGKIGPLLAAFIGVSGLSFWMPGGWRAQLPFIGILGAFCVLTTFRVLKRMKPYTNAELTIYNADPEKWKAIDAELSALAREDLKSPLEEATVSLQL